MTLVDVNRIIEERVNIVDVVRRYVKLQSSGRRQTGLCPFHKEKSPSFGVNEEKQFYHCFGCGAHGNALTFLMNIESLSFREAVKKLGTDFGIRELLQEQSSPEADRSEEERRRILSVNRLAALFFHRKLAADRTAVDYLERRGITKETVTRFGLGWIGNGDELITFLRDSGVPTALMEKSGLARIDQAGHLRSFFHNRIMIPVVNQRRQVIGFGGRIIGPGEPKYLNTSETPVFLKRASLFGINLVRDGLKDHKYLILTEGYFDVMALHAHGFTTAVAALGTAISEEHMKLIERFGVPLVMILDGDAAGRKAMRRVLELALPEKLDLRAAFIESPDGKEDPDSLVRRPDGKERMEAVIAGAKNILQHYLEELTEQALMSANLPERDLAKEEMARLLLPLALHRRADHLSLIERHCQTIPSVKADETKALMRHLQAILRKERGRPGYAAGAKTADREKDQPAQTARQKQRSPGELMRKLLLLAATHQSLIPALDDPANAFLARYDGDEILGALLGVYDTGDGSYEQLIATIDRDGRLAGDCAKLDDIGATREFQRTLYQLCDLDMKNTIKDLVEDGSPEAQAEIQRLQNKRQTLSAALTMGTGAAT